MTIWKDIPGFDGLYRCSSDGVIQSCHKRGSRTGERGEWWNLSRPLAKSGHELVYLWDKNNTPHRVRRLVHQIVAELFVPLVVGKPDVNHVNGNKRDNRHTNLEWCTKRENMQHAWRTGLCKPHKLTESDVRRILVSPYNDTETGKRFGVSQVMITRIRARKAWRHVPDPREEF